jgi:hypothetical protein
MREILARNAREHVAREFSMGSNMQRLTQQIFSSIQTTPAPAPVTAVTPAVSAAQTRVSNAVQDR